MLTYTQLENHCQYALEGATTLPQGITLAQVINLAGSWFFSAHPWAFREGVVAKLHLTADQEHVDLPADFGALTVIQMTESLTSTISLTTPGELIARRVRSVTVTQQHYWVALVQGPKNDRAGAFPPPRLEIWPTPATNSENAITVVYRRKWLRFADTTADTSVDTVPVPEYAEMALIQAARYAVTGWGERLMQPQGGIDTLLNNLKKGAIWQAAVEEDGLQQPNYGPLSGGAIEDPYERLGGIFTTATTSANPA